MRKQIVNDVMRMMKLYRSAKHLVVVENKTGEVLHAMEQRDRFVKSINNDNAEYIIVVVK